MKHEFFIAGVQHHEYKRCLNELEAGMVLILDPEPTNKYDPNAVKIVYEVPGSNEVAVEESFMLGYVPAKLSSSVLAMMEINDKVTCTLTELNRTAKPWEMLKVTVQPEEEPSNV